MNEADLIKAAKKNDETAIALLYKANFDWLYRFVRSRVDGDETAEDITADAFYNAFANISKFRAKSTFKTWIYTIARNEVTGWYRRKDKTISLSFEPEGYEHRERHPEDHNLQEADNSGVEKLVKKILGQMKDRYREVLELRYISRLSVKETALAMEISENNAKVLQNRALAKARKIMNFKQ
ncbi:MAG: RNA polymerase sigma factor [Candidatus Dojkabacteria bacterium]